MFRNSKLVDAAQSNYEPRSIVTLQLICPRNLHFLRFHYFLVTFQTLDTSINAYWPPWNINGAWSTNQIKWHLCYMELGIVVTISPKDALQPITQMWPKFPSLKQQQQYYTLVLGVRLLLHKSTLWNLWLLVCIICSCCHAATKCSCTVCCSRAREIARSQ